MPLDSIQCRMSRGFFTTTGAGYTVDTCPHATCADCRFYKVNADQDGVVSSCKRIDHKKVRFYRPWFATETCGQYHIPCADFLPKFPDHADFKPWTNFEDFWRVYKEAWLPYGNENTLVSFFIDGNTKVAYSVPLRRFLDGTMIQDGVLQAVERMYYRRGKKEYGIQLYDLVHQKVNGIRIPGWAERETA